MEKLLKRKKRAETTNNKTLLASVCVDLASLYLDNGEYHSAIEEYKTLALIYNEQKKSLDYACANRMIGEAYMQLNMFDEALKYVNIYLNMARKGSNKMEEQRALATIGHILLTKSLCSEDESNQQSLKLAAKNFLASLNICEKLTGISKHEQMDMLARLFSNLGIVKEAQGDFEKGIELVQKGINICKKYDLFEQLERGYTTLSSLYSKIQDFGSAIANINLAVDIAGRLPDKISLICSSLLMKAEILVKMSDLQGAKRVLHKAYKFKSPLKQDRDNIEQSLKIVAAMNNAEESLLIVSETNFARKKKLYERLGDGYCHFKNFDKAIYYYKVMLEYAEKNGESGRDLSPCFSSLAQTYQDNREYDNAIEFYRKDLEVCQGNIKETVNTLLLLTEAMDLGGKDIQDILEVFNEAKTASVCNRHLYFKVLKRLFSFLRKRHKYSDAFTVERELEALNVEDSQSDNEVEDLQELTDNIGDDVDLNNITDLSSSDDEKVQATRATRKRTKTMAIKKNAKGESQLHVAAINGNTVLVKKLLDQGHVVNIRDNAGWLPIHEACICGHLDIVKMLVEKGAAINDRGGTLCNGITPLHDAASNGHLEVIEYMLEKGASPLAKNDNGETPLYFLKQWKESVDLDEEETHLYHKIYKKMSESLSRAGQRVEEPKPNVKRKSNEALVLQELDESVIKSTQQNSSQSKTKLSTKKNSPLKNYKNKPDLRRDINAGDSDDDISLSTSCSVYKDAMNNLRSNALSENSQNQSKKRKSNSLKSAHLLPEEVDDDWLIDDLLINNPKKRRNLSCDLIITSNLKNKDQSIEFSENLVPDKSDVRKRQSSLLKAGFTKKKSNTSITSNSSGKCSHSSPQKMEIFDSIVDNNMSLDFPLSTPVSIIKKETTTGLIGKKSVFVDVQIEGQLFRISVTTDDLEVLNIAWLAEEASNRYYKKEAIKPKIELQTKNGALLSDEDFLYTLFPLGTTQCEELKAKVITWNIPPLSERYKDVCKYLNLALNETLLEKLEVATETLKLSDQNLRTSILPVFKALNRQTNLFEFDLSGNLFGNKMLEALCETLPSLNNLMRLNLATNHITFQGLQYLADTLDKQPTVLENLKELDLSYNPLNNEAFKSLSRITIRLKLHSLCLQSVGFTKGLFNNVLFQNRGCDIYLKEVKKLDLSFNEIGITELRMFLEKMVAENVEYFNFENCIFNGDEFLWKLVSFLDIEANELKLRKLNVAGSEISDVVAVEMLRIFKNCKNLEELDLSSCAISAASFKRFLEESSAKKIIVLGCKNLTENESLFMGDWNFKQIGRCKELWTTLDYTKDFIQCDTLINMFKNQYHNTEIDGLENGMLCIQVNDDI